MFRDRHKNPNPKPKHKNHTNAIKKPRAMSLPQLHQATFTHSKLPNPRARKKPTQTFHNSYWHSYPEHNLHTASCQTPCQKTSPYIFRSSYWYSYPQHSLHTASCQTRMPGRHRRTFFAAPISTATPNTIYTQQAAKPACQEDIAVHFSQLLLAQLPRTQFTHSKLPNPHARKTPPYIFRSSYWHSYPEHSLHTASCQTRMPARHRRTFFASPIGTPTPNTVCAQQAAKPNARKTPPYIFRRSYWHSYPEHPLHTASFQTRMPGIRHRPTVFAAPIGTATPNTVYTQQPAKSACQEDITAKFSHLLLAQLPRTQFTHSKAPNPHARKTSPQYVRTSYWHSYPEHSLHTASCQTRMPGRHHRKIFAPPIGTATPNTVYTQQAAKPACQEDTAVHFSQLLLARLPPTTFTHSKLSNPHVRKTPATTRRAATLSRSSEYCACHTDRSRGPAATRRAATLSRGSEYCACHTDRSRGPAATRRAATLSRGSEYCACHTERSAPQPFLEALSTAPATQRGAAGQRRPGAPQPFLEALNTAPATQRGAAGQRWPGAPQPFLEALSTAPATQRGAAGQRRPGVPQPFLEALSTAPATQRGAAGQRRPGAPQPFLEALSTAPATQRGAAGQRRPGAPQPIPEALSTAPATQRGAAGQRRPGFQEALSTAPATQTGAAGQRRPGAPQPFQEALNTAPATQRGAAGQRRPGAPQPFLEALSTAPATQRGAAGQRRPGAPQPFLEALSTAPATQRGAAGQRRPGAPQPFLEALRLWVLRLPRRQEPRTSGDQARSNPF